MKVSVAGVLVLLISMLLVSYSSSAFVEAPRRSRAIDDKVKNLDASTKKRVLDMKASGMPKEAIAKKIQYEVGNEGVARKMVDAIETDSAKAKYTQKLNAKAASERAKLVKQEKRKR